MASKIGPETYVSVKTKIHNSFKNGSRSVRVYGGDTESGQILQPEGAKNTKDDKINGQVSETEGKMVKLVEEYVDIFEKEALPPMDTEPMVITLKENYVPKAMMVPRKVPYARRDQEIKEIRKLDMMKSLNRWEIGQLSFAALQYVRSSQMEL